MQYVTILSVLFSLCLVGCGEDEKATEVKKDVADYDYSTDSSVYSGEMKRYWLVLLKKGTARNQDSIEIARIQAAHMNNINRLAREGKIILAGPMGHDGDLRGIFILDCKDSAEVEQIVSTDSAVISGRLKMEYYPWWSEKGKYILK